MMAGGAPFNAPLTHFSKAGLSLQRRRAQHAPQPRRMKAHRPACGTSRLTARAHESMQARATHYIFEPIVRQIANPLCSAPAQAATAERQLTLETKKA